MTIQTPLAVVILAAGQGKRMGSDLPKVMLEASGSPLLKYVIDSALALSPERVVLITGHKRELIEQYVSSYYAKQCSQKLIRTAVQKEQKGTGDAVKAAVPELAGFKGSVLILYGDTPLLLPSTLKGLLTKHESEKATLSLISVITPLPDQYGRIIRDQKGQVQGIREFRDCSAEEAAIQEINSGIYVVDSAFLPKALEQLKNENNQGEFYLTDIVAQASSEGQQVSTLVQHSLEETQGVNTRADLATVEQVLRSRKVRELLNSGVTIQDTQSVFIGPEVEIAAGVTIGPQVTLSGKTRISAGVIIEGSSYLHDAVIENNVRIRAFSYIEGATVQESALIGPFTRLREETVVGPKSKVGNFVEIKKATLGEDVKASHLSYLGDCTIGKGSNIGAGTITCNYDGYNKFKTSIGEGVFVGSNSSLVAPVRLDDGATIGAGSVITKNVPQDSLALTRSSLEIKEGWSKRKREVNAKKK